MQHPSRAAPLAAAVLALLAVSACSLVSLEGLSGGIGPSDASTGGAESEAGAAGGYPGQVLADAPLAYWRFDEHTGTTAVDSSGHGNDATYEGGITLGAPGAIAQPQSTYAGVASRNDAVGGPPSEGYLLFVTPTHGPFGFQRLDGASVSTAVSVAGPSASDFTYVVATFDGLELVVYVNGGSQGSQTASFSIAGAVADFVVGAEAGGNDNFLSGSLDEVPVYDHALSADRVRAHYLAGIGSP